MKKRFFLPVVPLFFCSVLFAQEAPRPDIVGPAPRPDLIVEKVAVSGQIADHRSGTTVIMRQIKYTIKNIGNASIALGKIKVMGYANSDDVHIIADMAPACGKVAMQNSTTLLMPGNTFNGSFYCTENGNWDKQVYYLLKVDHLNLISESNETNNEKVTTIAGNTGMQ